MYGNWAQDVILWWNKIIRKYVHKNKQLFLYGRSDVGKSSLIERIIGRHNLKYIFYPGVGQFFMQSYEPEIHKVIVFEEFNLKFYEMSFLKRLLEGRPFAYPVKGGIDKQISHCGPIIFISNYYPGEFDTALFARLLLVNAETPYWEGIQLSVPKEEEEVWGGSEEGYDTVDQIVVSSDSES